MLHHINNNWLYSTTSVREDAQYLEFNDLWPLFKHHSVWSFNFKSEKVFLFLFSCLFWRALCLKKCDDVCILCIQVNQMSHIVLWTPQVFWEEEGGSHLLDHCTFSRLWQAIELVGDAACTLVVCCETPEQIPSPMFPHVIEPTDRVPKLELNPLTHWSQSVYAFTEKLTTRVYFILRNDRCFSQLRGFERVLLRQVIMEHYQSNQLYFVYTFPEHFWPHTFGSDRNIFFFTPLH